MHPSVGPNREHHPQKPVREIGWLISIAVHVAAVGALLWLHGARPPPPSNTSQILANFVELPEPPGPESPAADSPAPGPPVQAPPVQAPPSPAETVAEPVAEQALAEVVTTRPNTSDLLSDAQVVSAVAAGEGGDSGPSGGNGGGGCNTAQVLQTALRRDPMVLKAITNAGRLGKAVILWDGDWVRSGDQDGKGLSGVRQAILWTLAFAPEACRNKAMEGLVLISLAGDTRLAIGTDRWRWSDLLGLGEGGGAGPPRGLGPDPR